MVVGAAVASVTGHECNGIRAVLYTTGSNPHRIVSYRLPLSAFIQVEKDAKRRVSHAKLQDYVEDVNLFAKVDTVLMVCDSEKFEKFLSEQESIRPEIENITKSDIGGYLEPLPFLKGIKESQITVLAAMCRYEAMDASTNLFAQGDDGDKLYILLAGQCDVLIDKDADADAEKTSPRSGSPKPNTGRAFRKSIAKTKNGELFSEGYKNEKAEDLSPRASGQSDDESQTFLASLKAGDYFGETALMVNIPRTTTVRTRKKSLFLTIDKRAFHNFLRVCPDVKERMNQLMKDRMMSKLSNMDIPFFQGISPSMFSEFAHSVQMHEMDKDAVVFKEGEMGDRFYIIIHGEVRVECDGIANEGGDKEGDDNANKKAITRQMTMDIGHLGPGKYFGEMALVAHSERSASVICNTHAIIMSIGSNVFHKIFDSNPQALCEFKLRCLQAKAELKHILSHPTGLSMFDTFLKKELADENIQFWTAVNDFKETVSKESAQALYEKYISEAADLQVNVPGKMRKAIKAVVDGEEITEDIFEGSQNEIYKLMVRDNFARFKKTEEFKNFFENLGIFLND